MARDFARGCAVLITLALAPVIVPAQVQQTTTGPSEKAPASQLNPRIISLVEQLADQSRASDDLAFSVHAQAQAAALLWSHSPARARLIYRRAFESIATPPKRDQRPNSSDTLVTGTSSELSVASKRHLRSELLNQIAARDADLAEELARSIADRSDGTSRDCLNGNCSSNGIDQDYISSGLGVSPGDGIERRELLMSAAVQVVEREPEQAMAFAQMSVALGISPNLARFLTLMRVVDAERADLLFSNAVARLEESRPIDLTEVHTLGSFVVSVVNSSSSKQVLDRALVVRFVNLALSGLLQDEASMSVMNSRDESASYFIARQLRELVARYVPERAAQLRRDVFEASESDTASVWTVDEFTQSIEPGVATPGEIARQAREATDKGERDSLWARSALEWLAKGNLKEAREAALAVAGESTRDRVLAQVIRRCSSEKRIDEALELARRVVDISLRADLVAMLASPMLAAKDENRATDLLSEAASYSAKAPSIDRARLLIRIAGGFAAFDELRAFEMLQSAIRAINETTGRQQEARDEPASAIKNSGRNLALEDLNATSFERTLAQLAMSDFDRALALAQQVSIPDASTIAQLAVCKAGLTQRAQVVITVIDDEGDSSLHRER